MRAVFTKEARTRNYLLGGYNQGEEKGRKLGIPASSEDISS